MYSLYSLSVIFIAIAGISGQGEDLVTCDDATCTAAMDIALADMDAALVLEDTTKACDELKAYYECVMALADCNKDSFADINTKLEANCTPDPEEPGDEANGEPNAETEGEPEKEDDDDDDDDDKKNAAYHIVPSFIMSCVAMVTVLFL